MGEFDDRLNAIERLLALFRFERMAYLVITTLALAMLLGSAGYLIINQSADAATLVMLFGSSGLITVALARLLRMWDQAMALIGGSAPAQGE